MLRRLRHFRPAPPILAAAVVLSSLPATSAAAAVGSPVAQARCTALAGAQLSDVDGWPARVTQTSYVAGTATDPGHCDVSGTVTVSAARDRSTSVIGFQVLVPEGWNHRYLQLGGGGFCGSVPTQSGAGGPYLRRGYAVASDDGGHRGGGLDGSFGYHNVAAELTWGRLSEHLTSLAAKLILRATAGSRPAYSYFVGCSTGGRQALVEAQQFPRDFDGIVGGAPANRQNELAPLSQGVRELQNRDAQRHVIVDATAARLVQQAAVRQCDALDGLADGIIRDPRACHLSLASLRCAGTETSGCLTGAQLAVLARWYDSPRATSGRELYPGGLPVGSEGGWPFLAIGTDTSLSGGGQFAEQVLRYLAFPVDPGPSYSLFDFDPDRDAGKLRSMDRVYNADSTNMTAFRNRGGKLITWQGFADPLITPYGLIQYYEDVVGANGGSLSRTAGWYRTFLLPGVYHCSGGPGPDQVDWLAAISSWVEHGIPPQRVVATKVGSDGAVVLRRPVYPYPFEAAYNGSGSPNDPDSFHPIPGPRGREVTAPGR